MLALQLTSLHGVTNAAPVVHPYYIHAVTHMQTHRGKHGQRFMQSVAHAFSRHLSVRSLCQSTPSAALLTVGELILQSMWFV